MSLFSTLHIALKGLQAQQKGMAVTGHNIANANTEGYSRQQVILKPSRSIEIGGMRYGTGVDVAQVRRIRDEFLDMQLRSVKSKMGYWKAKQDVLEQVEVIYMEPSENGISTLLTRFWDSWQEVSKNPENSAIRVNLIENASALTDAINATYRDLDELKIDINRTLQTTVQEINNTAQRIAELNDLINKTQVRGQAPNDLLDERTILLEELAQMVDIQAYSTDSNMVDVYLGGRPLVAGGKYLELDLNDNYELVWKNTPGTPVDINGGKVRGLIDAREEIENNYMADLNKFAEKLVEEVNKLHRYDDTVSPPNKVYGMAAYDEATGTWNNIQGGDFFEDVSGSSAPARDIKVHADIIADSNKIAAATSPDSPGDGSNALRIAQLKDKLVLNEDAGGNPTATFHSFFTDSISRLGVQAQQANNMVDNTSVMEDQLARRQESMAGVSLDEEVTNLVQYQHAFAAAAKVSAAIDEMLATLINRLG
ncbi:MAG: flagellar hook-associated protein FlgK [Thermoanaerobacteraceae bacterium]|nr:flagellar hook-associated protein FlgK [Thermoanaerobacteraceae bacterium]